MAIVLTGLERAGCSCADPASKLGRCKHAVGLLLWCKNENDAIWEFYVFLSIDISVRYYLNHGKHGLTEMTNQCPVKWHWKLDFIIIIIIIIFFGGGGGGVEGPGTGWQSNW